MDISGLSVKGSETYNRLCMGTDESVRLKDVILSSENQQKINSFMEERKNMAKLKAIGLEPVNRLLLYGASGTGKTYMTQAVANELGLPMLHLDISKLSEEKMAAGITDIFELAEELKSALIFLDECDSICWARDDDNNEDSAAIRRANNVLFQQLDHMSSSQIFVSATNLYDRLDAAFRRRFNIEMKFLAPKITDFSAAVARFIGPSFEYRRDMDGRVKAVVDYQALNYTHMSYYQIKDWTQRAVKAAVLRNRETIMESEIYGMLMQAMRMEVKYDDSGTPYLHQYGIQSR